MRRHWQRKGQQVLAPIQFQVVNDVDEKQRHHRIFGGHGRPLILHWQAFYLGTGGEGSLIFPFLYRT